MKSNKKIKIGLKIGLLFLALITTGASCSITGGNENKILGAQVNLEMWVVVESPQDYNGVIASFKKTYPNINIAVKKFRLEDYDDELLNALAEDRGPDIFMVHNTALRKNLSKIEPLPESVTIPRIFAKGNFTEDIVVEKETKKGLTPTKLREMFVDTVFEDVVIDGKIYGLPLYIDTLALYYNRDLLNIAGFAQPPQYWDQFQNMSSQLTKINSQNEIIQSGAALGTATNIQNTEDILALLMMQTGAEMTNANKTGATFHQAVSQGDSTRSPGIDALRFYSDFARTPPTTAYSWNEDQPDNLEAFINGDLAFFIGYAYHLPLIRTGSVGKLNFSIAPMVQIQNAPPVNVANYWMPVVSKKSKNIDASWHFIQQITSASTVTDFLSVVKKPTALRELIEDEKNNEEIFAFAGQSLVAKNWYYGYDNETAKKAFTDMITKSINIEEESTTRESPLKKALNDSATVINQTYKKR